VETWDEAHRIQTRGPLFVHVGIIIVILTTTAATTTTTTTTTTTATATLSALINAN